MRRYFILFAIAAGVLVACEQEQDLGDNATGGSSGVSGDGGGDSGVPESGLGGQGGTGGTHKGGAAGQGGNGGVGGAAGKGGAGGTGGAGGVGGVGGGTGGVGGVGGGTGGVGGVGGSTGGTGGVGGGTGGVGGVGGSTGGTGGVGGGTGGVGGSTGGTGGGVYPTIQCVGEQMNALALDDTFVYCTRTDGILAVEKTGKFNDPNTKTVMYVTTDPKGMGVAVDGTHVYLSRYQVQYGPTLFGAINYAPKVSSGMPSLWEMYVGNQDNPFDSHPFHSACGIIEDQDKLYWMSDGGVIVASKSLPDGGAPFWNNYDVLAQDFGLCSSAAESPYAITQDATTVYWVQGANVNKVAKAGGTFESIATTQQYLTSVVAYGGDVYFTGAGSGTNGGVVGKVPAGGGAETVLATGQSAPYGLAVDATHVYWTNKGSCSSPDGALRRMPIAGGTPETLAVGEQCPRGVVVDSTNVYWISVNPAQPEFSFSFRLAK